MIPTLPKLGDAVGELEKGMTSIDGKTLYFVARPPRNEFRG
jgi:hypothetical protein